MGIEAILRRGPFLEEWSQQEILPFDSTNPFAAAPPPSLSLEKAEWIYMDSMPMLPRARGRRLGQGRARLSSAEQKNIYDVPQPES